MVAAFFILLSAACLLAALFGGRILRFLSGPPPMPPGFEAPKPVPSTRDRLAMAQRRAHAREVAQADQEVHR